MTISYACRLEFHRWDDLDFAGGRKTVTNVGLSIVTHYRLDPGDPPDDPASQGECPSGKSCDSKKPKDAAKDPASQDAKANQGDKRKNRPKRKKSASRKPKTTKASKAKKRKSGGRKATKGNREKNLGNVGTIASVIKVPAATSGMAYFTDITQNFFLFLPVSGAQPYFEYISTNGGTVDDTVHLMGIPAVATVPPQFAENEFFVIYKFRYKITPRCVLPIGDQCKNDPGANKDSKKKKGGRKKAGKRRRKLLVRDRELLFDDEASDLDKALERRPASKQSRELARQIAEHHGRELHDMDRMYEDRQRYKAAMQGKDYDGSDALAVLGEGDGVDREAPAWRRRMAESLGKKYADMSKCFAITLEVIPETDTPIFERTFYFVVVVVPCSVRVYAGIRYSVDFTLTVCIIDKTVIAAITPTVALVGQIEAAIDIILIRVGLGVEAIIMETSLIPEATLSFKSGFMVCMAMDLVLLPLKITLYAFLEFLLCIVICKVCFSIGFAEICIPLPCPPFLEFCDPIRFDIWSFSLAPIRLNIFMWCNVPPDDTPPDIRGAVVSAKQIDSETISFEWGGFLDEESNVKGYQVGIGTGPGGQDVAQFEDVFISTSYTVNLLPLEGMDGRQVFACVRARNGEDLESDVCDAMVIDDSGPELVDCRIKKDITGEFSDEDLVKNGNKAGMGLRFHVRESNPEPNVFIKIVEYAVGLADSDYQSVSEWAEIPFSGTATDTGTAPGLGVTPSGPKDAIYQTNVEGLDLEHGVRYYIHSRTTNTVGRQAISTCESVLFADFTEPEPVLLSTPAQTPDPLALVPEDPVYPLGVGVHNGLSIYVEYLMEFLPLEKGDPEWSATTWMVGPRWEFADEESDVFDYDVELYDADNPEHRLAFKHADMETSTVLLTQLDLQHLHRYEIVVKARNEANIVRLQRSKFIHIDKTRPHARQALDLRADPSNDYAQLLTLPIDSSTANPGIIPPAEVFAIELDFVRNLDDLRLAWAVWDEDSGILHVEVAIGFAPGGTDVMDWTPVNADYRWASVPFAGDDLIEHTRYYVAVQAVNGAGSLSLWASADGVMIDNTEAVCVEYRVRDGSHWILDSDFHSDPTMVVAQWKSAMFDLESLISHFTAELRDMDTGDVIVGPVYMGLITNSRMTELDLQHKQRVQTVVTAYNRALAPRECATDGMLVDLTGPLLKSDVDAIDALVAAGGVVSDDPYNDPAVYDTSIGLGEAARDGNNALFGFEGTDLDYTWSTRSAFGSWPQFVDPESGLSHYEVWAESLTGARLTRKDWVHRSLTEFTQSIPEMGHGDQYRYVVRAINRAGSFDTHRTDGIEVDVTPPFLTSEVDFIIDGNVGMEDHIITAEDTNLRIDVTAKDPESGILRCRYAVGTYPGGSDLTTVRNTEVGDMEPVDVEEVPRGGMEVCPDDDEECFDWPAYTTTEVKGARLNAVLNEGTPLLNRFTFYMWFLCVNNANNFVRALAPRSLVVDAQPPVPGLLFDALQGKRDKKYTPANNVLSAWWRWWVDFETDIAYYEACAGTDPADPAKMCDIADWKDVGLETSVFFALDGSAEHPFMEHSTTAYITVRATDKGYHQATLASNGVTVDLTPPDNGEIEHGLNDEPVRKYTARDDVVLMRWLEAADIESGETLFEFGLSLSPIGDAIEGLPDMVPLVAVGLARQAAVVNIRMEHAKVYYGAVRTRNGVGLTTLTYSRGVLVDLTGPQCDLQDGFSDETFPAGEDLELDPSGVARAYISCTDLESGFERLKWGLGTMRGMVDTLPYTEAAFTGVPVPEHVDAVWDVEIGSPYHKAPTRMMEADIQDDVLDRLLDGVRYFVATISWNGAGTRTFDTTNGQVHDKSAPVSFLSPRDGSLGVDQPRDVDFTKVTDSWGARWIYLDPHTGLPSIEAQLLHIRDDQGNAVDPPEVVDTVTGDEDFDGPKEKDLLGTAYGALLNGHKYQVTVTATNGVGLQRVELSDGFTVDTTAPVWPTYPTNGLDAAVNDGYVSEVASLAACWEATEPESAVDHYDATVVAVLHGTGADYGPCTELNPCYGPHLVQPTLVQRSASETVTFIQDQVSVEGVTCARVSGLALQHAHKYAVKISAVNAVGLVADAHGFAVAVDTTPPILRGVSVFEQSTFPGADDAEILANYAAGGNDADALFAQVAEGVSDPFQHSSKDRLVAFWSGVSEDVSPIVAVHRAIGTQPGLDDVLRIAEFAHTEDGVHAFDAAADGFTLSDGGRYFVTLWATNDAGLTASLSTPGTGTLIDTTPPDFAALPQDPFVPKYAFPNNFNEQAGYPTTVNNVGIYVPLTPFTDVDSLLPGVTVTVYQSAADPETLYPGYSQDPPAGSSLDDLLAALVDPLEMAAQGIAKVAGPNKFPEKLRAEWPSRTVQDDTYLFAVVTVTNGVTLQTTRATPGAFVFTDVISAGVVNDGSIAGEDADYQPSTQSFSVNWQGFVDPQGGPVLYKVALGSQPDLDDIRAWDDTVREKTYLDVLQDFQVPLVTTVYATVEACDERDICVRAESNGMVLGSTFPEVGANGNGVVVFNSAPPPLDAQAVAPAHVVHLERAPLTVAWDISDSDEVLSNCTVSVGYSPGSAEHYQTVVPAATTSLTITANEMWVYGAAGATDPFQGLAEGSQVHATVSCQNIRGLVSEDRSEWAVVDSTDPLAGVVYNGPASSDGHVGIHNSATEAALHWFDFTDPQADFDFYTVCLGSAADPCAQAGPRVVSAAEAVDNAATVSFSGLALQSGADYVWTVTGTTFAGREVSAESAPFVVDVVAPDVSAVSVTIGPTPGVHVDTQHTDEYLEVTWEGFTDAVQLGLSHYEVRAGTTAGGDDVAAAVSVPVLGSDGQSIYDDGSNPGLPGDNSFVLDHLEDFIDDGESVYVTVVACDNALPTPNCDEATSSATLVDTTPPQLPASGGTPTDSRAVVDIAVEADDSILVDGEDDDVGDNPRIAASWEAFTDDHTGIDHYEAAIEDITAFPNVIISGGEFANMGLAQSFTNAGLTLTHGHTYRVRVRAFNGVGDFTEGHSDGIAVDLTIPRAGTVRDGHVRGEDSTTQGAVEIAAHWDGFNDDESSIVNYNWCVGTQQGTDDVVACRDLGVATSASASLDEADLEALIASAYGAATAQAVVAAGVEANGRLSDDAAAALLAAVDPDELRLPSLFHTVTVRNERGLENTAYSNGVSFDLIPPTAGFAIDGTLDPDVPDASIQTSASVIRVAFFDFADAQTGIDHFEVVIGSTPGADDLSPVARLPPSAESYRAGGLPLGNGATYFATVTAVDGAGLRTSVTTNGIKVDHTPPAVQAQVAPAGATVPVSEEGDEVFVSSLVTAVLSGTTLEEATLDVAWAGVFVDPETGGAGDTADLTYMVRVCPVVAVDGGAGCMLDWTDRGGSTDASFTASALDVTPGVVYTVQVRASNVASLSATATQLPDDGFYIDVTEPEVGFVVVMRPDPENAATVADGDARVKLLNSWDVIRVRWYGFADPESGVVEYRVCAGTTPQADDIVACTTVDADTTSATLDGSESAVFFDDSVDIAAPTLTPNITNFYVTVFATNAQGLVSNAASDPVQVDITPPLQGTAVDGRTGSNDAYVGPETDVFCASIEDFEDMDSGLSHYRMAVGTGGAGTDDVAAWRTVQPEDVATLAEFLVQADAFGEPSDAPAPESQNELSFQVLCARGLSMVHGDTLTATVQVWNQAGLFSTASTDGAVVVSLPPAAGAVRDLPMTPNPDNVIDEAEAALGLGGTDVEFASTRLNIGALWEGFGSGASDGPISRYHVAVCGEVSGCNNEANPLSFFADVDLNTRVQLGASVLAEGERYRVIVRATDVVGQTSEAESDGFVLDVSPPRILDPDDNIRVLSLGVMRDSVNPRGFAFDALGETPLSDADVDAAIALHRAAAEEAAGGNVALWHQEGAPMHVAWKGLAHDPETDIDRFEVCVGSSGLAVQSPTPDAGTFDDVMPCRDVGLAQYAVLSWDSDFVWTPDIVAAADSAAAQGVLYVTVRAWSKAGVPAQGSKSVAIDPSPPTGLYVFGATDPLTGDEVAFTHDPFSWQSAWDAFEEFESGVALYTWTLLDLGEVYSLPVDENGEVDIEQLIDAETGFLDPALVTPAVAAGPIDVGLELEATSTQLDLQHAHAYATQVVARNFAGLTGVALSEAVVVDLTGPVSSLVLDPDTGDTSLAGYVHDGMSLAQLRADREQELADLRDDEESAEEADRGIEEVLAIALGLEPEDIIGPNQLDDADLPPMPDIDFGDAEEALLAGHWGGWEDAESGVDHYEWAIMALDPRVSNPVSSTLPGATLRDALAEFMAINDLSEQAPVRQYGTGLAHDLTVAESGVLMSDFLDVGHQTHAYREDVELKSGFTYVLLVKIVNRAGLETVVASDGVVFDATDPCMGRPHLGHDPFFIPEYLNNNVVSAVWGASIDPLYERGLGLPFECLSAVDSQPGSDASTAAGEGSDVSDLDNSVDTSQGTGAGLLLTVPVSPISHFEWQMRRLLPQFNDTFLNGTGVIFENVTEAGYPSAEEPFEAPESDFDPYAEEAPEDPLEDEAPDLGIGARANQTAASVVTMVETYTSTPYLSPWSGCCSSYSEHAPQVIGEDWDWRPVGVSGGATAFGADTAMLRGRFVSVTSRDAAYVFDSLVPSGPSFVIHDDTVNAAAGLAYDDLNPAPFDAPYLSVDASDMLVVTTATGLAVFHIDVLFDATGGPAFPWEANQDVVTQPPYPVAGVSADSAMFQIPVSGVGFTGQRFARSLAVDGNTIAVTLDGVWGSGFGRMVAVLAYADGAGLSLVTAVASTEPAFGHHVALGGAVAGTSLLVSEPDGCIQEQAGDLGDPNTPWVDVCDAFDSAPALPGSVRVFDISGPPQLTTNLADLVLPLVPTEASSAFGASVASSASFAVVGDPAADDGAGAVHVFVTSDHPEVPGSAPVRLCSVAGSIVGSGLGYSVSVVTAAEEGRDDEGQHPAYTRNKNTALVAAGGPAGNAAEVLRVNLTAAVAGGIVNGAFVLADDPSVCLSVAVLRQQNAFAATPPLFGAGTSVTIGGSMVVFTSPFTHTWPTQGTNTVVPGSMDGTGRVFGTSFCWAGDAREAATFQTGGTPLVCKPCDSPFAAAAGGVGRTCEDCQNRQCRGVEEAPFFTASNSTAPLENGEMYEIDVTAVSFNGRRNTQTSPRFTVDLTPPDVGDVWDAFLGNATGCPHCTGEMNVTTNVTYVAISWCCGWHDDESDIVAYHVIMGTQPGATDILDWTDAGLLDTFAVDWPVFTGLIAYGCVVAENGAGLFSDMVCSDGVMYDFTPPDMLYVNDGIAFPDVDAQAYLNMAFVNYLGHDVETIIAEYEMSFGTSAGSTDLLHWEGGGNATLNGVIGRSFRTGEVLPEGFTLFANIRATNMVGLTSTVMSSDGVKIGKGEITLGDEAHAGIGNGAGAGGSSVLSLNTQLVQTAEGAGAGKDPVADSEVTIAAVEFPAAAVPDGEPVTFVGGAVNAQDVADGDAVEPENYNNFKFGDYTFTLQAQGEPGYVFAEPIFVTMFYKIDDLISEGQPLEEASNSEWYPELEIYDVNTLTWIPAIETCPEEQRHQEINYDTQAYTVSVCHLTQYAMFFQQRPVALFGNVEGPVPEPEPVPFADVPQMQTLAATEYNCDPALLACDPDKDIIIVQLDGQSPTGYATTFDGSGSYDPDAYLVGHSWHMEVTPEYAALHTARDGVPFDPLADAGTFSVTDGPVTTFTPERAGVVNIQLEVVDNDGADTRASFWMWFNEQPVASFVAGDSLTVHAAADVPVSVSVDAGASSDFESLGITFDFTIVPASLVNRPAGGDGRGAPPGAPPNSPVVGASHLAPHVGVVSGLRGGAEVDVEVEVSDGAGGFDTDTIHVIVNAIPVVAGLEAPDVVYLGDSGLTAEPFTVALDVFDPDGDIVSAVWTVAVDAATIVGDASAGDIEAAYGVAYDTPAGSAFATSVEVAPAPRAVGEAIDVCVVQISVVVTDNEGATAAVSARVAVKNTAVAIGGIDTDSLPAGVDPSAIVSGPAWAPGGMTTVPLDGSASSDIDGPIAGYEWFVASTTDPRGAAAVSAVVFSDRTGVTTAFCCDYGAYDYDIGLAIFDALGVRTESLGTTPIRVVLVAAASAGPLLSVLEPAPSVALGALPFTTWRDPAADYGVAINDYSWSIVTYSLQSGGTCDTAEVAPASGAAVSLQGLCGRGDYELQLDVSATIARPGDASDAQVVVASAPLTVTVHAAPVADLVMPGDANDDPLGLVVLGAVRADGSGSWDDGALSYRWTIEDAVYEDGTPAAQPHFVAALSSPTSAVTDVVAAGMGSATVRLTVTDSVGATDTATRSITMLERTSDAAIVADATAAPSPPATGDVNLNSPAQFVLDALTSYVSASYEATHELAFAWSLAATTDARYRNGPFSLAAGTAALISTPGADQGLTAVVSGDFRAESYTVRLVATSSYPTTASELVVLDVTHVPRYGDIVTAEDVVVVEAGSAARDAWCSPIVTLPLDRSRVHAAATFTGVTHAVTSVDLLHHPTPAECSGASIFNFGAVEAGDPGQGLAASALALTMPCGAGAYSVRSTATVDFGGEAHTTSVGATVLLHDAPRPAISGAAMNVREHVLALEGTTITLSAALSSDDYGIAEHTWSIGAVPEGRRRLDHADAAAAAVLHHPTNGADVQLTVPVRGALEVTLTVTDTHGASATATTHVEVFNAEVAVGVGSGGEYGEYGAYYGYHASVDSYYDNNDNFVNALGMPHCFPNCPDVEPCLWPNDHEYVCLDDATTLVDSSADALCDVTVTVAQCTSSEPDDGPDDGDTVNDCTVSGNQVCMRAEAASSGTGRVYHLEFSATDAAGNSRTLTRDVFAPVDACGVVGSRCLSSDGSGPGTLNGGLFYATDSGAGGCQNSFAHIDECPDDYDKLFPGQCGCGVDDLDSDGDGVADCLDQCVSDASKTAPGQCGCGAADADVDGDNVADCEDTCPTDPAKAAPGLCGCFVSDVDTDSDLTPDCHDECPTDPNKVAPGQCGCGVADDDQDGDGVARCLDFCYRDPAKTDPGVCGCRNPDTDTDGDLTPDCVDECPDDPDKAEEGACGCGEEDVDTDGDGTPDCIDVCYLDPYKIVPGPDFFCGCGCDGCPDDPEKGGPGQCGCGVPDVHSDADGFADCVDACPFDSFKIAPGECGCGVSDGNSDFDDTPDCFDDCPYDSSKVEPGQCGCRKPDTDADGDGYAWCLDECDNDPLKLTPGVNGCGFDDCPLDDTKYTLGVCGCGVPDIDTDEDGALDCTEECPFDPAKTLPLFCGCGEPETGDSDGDGVCDHVDQCVGDDATGDNDSDGICDDLDPDNDNDGIINENDCLPLNPYGWSTEDGGDTSSQLVYIPSLARWVTNVCPDPVLCTCGSGSGTTGVCHVVATLHGVDYYAADNVCKAA